MANLSDVEGEGFNQVAVQCEQLSMATQADERRDYWKALERLAQYLSGGL